MQTPQDLIAFSSRITRTTLTAQATQRVSRTLLQAPPRPFRHTPLASSVAIFVFSENPDRGVPQTDSQYSIIRTAPRIWPFPQ